MFVQLLIVGQALDWIFEQNHPAIILLIATFMTAIAAWSAWGRTRRHLPGHYWNCLISILISSFLITGFAIKGILQLENWYSPHYLIPLLGMVIGNTLNGISLDLDRFLDDLYDHRNLVETSLSLGATAWEASHLFLHNAMRTEMIPIINSVAVMGVVSLPRMMTEQILVGASPSEAVRYQIIITFMITSATTLGAVMVLFMAFKTQFSSRQQLKHKWILSKGK